MRAAEFAMEMVPHHEDAIRMAEAFLSGPDAGDSMLRPIAEAIIKGQQAEVEVLKKFAKKAGVPQRVGKEFHEADKRKRGKKGLREYMKGGNGKAP